MQLAPGARLGPYELLASVGAGGMGEVWRARDTRIGREVAVKIIPAAFAADTDRLHRFEQEVRAAGTLNHPNLVTIHDLGADNGTPYVVMELLEGETLREKLELDGAPARLPFRKVVDYSTQIAAGLGAAHDKGIVHRDLKPENIFITRDGRAKILDFGLAKLRGAGNADPDGLTEQRHTLPGSVLGTAGYMSPEQVRGQPVDHRSDIFSLGAILYEMLAGRRAFKGDSSVETMNAILKEDPPELTVDGGVPPAVDVIVRHCLEKHPDERFQSARDLAFDLSRLSAISGSGPAIDSPRRAPWIAAALASAAIAIAVFLAWRIGYRKGSAEQAVAQPSARIFKLLTSQPGVERYPSLAPDGKTFVYVSEASGNADIYLQRVDGRNAINLTKGSAAENTQPAFSPDGSLIAFRSSRDGGGIFVMGATGESVRRLSDTGFNPSWSPDGSEIVVSTNGVDLSPQSRPGRSALIVIDVHTGSKRVLVDEAHDGVQPSWSAHGDRIAYWNVPPAGGQRDLWTVDPHAAHPMETIEKVTNDAALDWNPVWSPDGKFLYFGTDRNGTMNLFRIPMDEHSGKPAGAPEPMSVPARFAAHFTIAKNGALAFAAIEWTDTLSRVAFDPVSLRVSGRPTPVLGGVLLVENRSCEVSPDGRSIAFGSWGLQEDIFVARADGTEIRQLTNDPEKDRGPSWSNDGKLLYFYSQRGPRYEVWSINADGSGLRQVSHTTGEPLWFPRPSRDGSALYEFNSTNAYRLPFNSDGTVTRAEPFPPMSAGRRFGSPRESPDGKMFVGQNLANGTLEVETELWLYDPAKKTYERLSVGGRFPWWLPDSRRVLFNERGQVKVVDVVTRRVSVVPLLGEIRDCSISPDGRVLYLTRRNAEADIWMMTEKSGHSP